MGGGIKRSREFRRVLFIFFFKQKTAYEVGL